MHFEVEVVSDPRNDNSFVVILFLFSHFEIHPNCQSKINAYETKRVS